MTTAIQTLSPAHFGTFVTTASVADKLPSSLIMRFLERHMSNDWGELDECDADCNAIAVKAGIGRIHSVYSFPGLDEDIWIITYLQRDPILQKDVNYCNTTVLFPSEY